MKLPLYFCGCLYQATINRIGYLASLGSAGLILLHPQPGIANEWGLKPLGPVIEVKDKGAPPVKQELKSLRQKFPTEGAPLTLFKDGTPKALLVLPESPTKTEQAAADLFRETLRKMTGANFPVLTEEKIRVENNTVVDTQGRAWESVLWIGNTKQAAAKGITAEDLRPEGYRLKSDGGWLFILGNDNGKSLRDLNGTVFAATTLLEDYLGVRWLWPGDEGTVIPKQQTVTLPALNEQNEPALAQRIIRNAGLEITDRHKVGLKLLGDSEKEVEIFLESLRKQGEWLRRQQCGSSLQLSYRHAFGGWYEKYGKEHPDWFALQPSGSRAQKTDRPRLCKANPEVAKQRAREIIEQYKANPNLDSASLSPNDGSGEDHFCMCEECRKLDPPNGNLVELMFSRDGKRFYEKYPALSDRLATFYNRIAEEVAKTLPDATLGAYAYSYYRDAPLGVTLHPSIIIGFVGLTYFNEEMRQSDLKEWNGWSRKASRLLLRPNLLIAGAALPAVYVNRLGEDIRHCYQTGMTLADFDSLVGHWSTQGLNYYVLAKLLWNPAADVDALVKDYCEKGFGTAAEPIREYFLMLEKTTLQVASPKREADKGELREEERDIPAIADPRRREQLAFESAYFTAFTPEVVGQLRGLLKKATDATEDAEVHARIAFLALGLDYLDLFQATLESTDNKQAKKNLLDWYRKTFHEHPHALGLVFHLFRTGASFRGIQ